jgi:hypothetical protein
MVFRTASGFRGCVWSNRARVQSGCVCVDKPADLGVAYRDGHGLLALQMDWNEGSSGVV